MRHFVSKFAENWLLPPYVTKLLRREKKLPKLQKFWMGEPVNPSSDDGQYFTSVGLSSMTITRRDDTRTAARIYGEYNFPVAITSGGSAIDFSIVCDTTNNAARLIVKTDIEEIEVTGLRKPSWGYAPGRWIDVRVKCSQDCRNIAINSSDSVFITRPRSTVISTVSANWCDNAPAPHHIVCLTLDGLPSWVFDKNLCLEDGSEITPNISQYFKKGLHSYNGYSSAEWTLPTIASMFSGLKASEHKMFHPRDNIYHRDDVKLLAETMKSADYKTICMSAASRINPAFGCHRGFDRFIYHWAEEGRSELDYSPSEWINELVGFISANRHHKTFSYLQFQDPHPAWDYGPLPQSLQLMRRGNRLAWNLSAMKGQQGACEQGRQLLLLRLHELDRMLGYLFHFLEQTCKNTATVILTSDHGTPWKDFRSNRAVDEPTLVEDRTRVPFLATGVGIPEKELSGLISPNIDLYPTIMAAAKIDPPAHLAGKDLTKQDCVSDYVVSESAFAGIYEIALNFDSGVWIEKFPYDDRSCKITGDAFYSNWFEKPQLDYNIKHQAPIPNICELTAQHITRAGLR